ncbi:MAG: substrate-binding domain-containing protein [Chitinispirillales bacterium]|jgi:phosphate transport system substrate-binding protein|nr:substrate-binding domain-containing protein [Chitinispirillales bacterium]
MNKVLQAALVSVLALTFSVSAQAKKGKNTEITVISREESSGTRGAFDELMKVSDGKTNMLFREAVIVSSTDEVASKVEVDKRAIGYTSLGSITNKVKALSIDGVAATLDNIKNNSYKVSRPFVVAVEKSASNPVAADFIKYVMSKEGQEIVAKRGYVTSGGTESYAASGKSGKLTLSGSTSVERVIEQLREGYVKLNPGVKVEINYNGSSAGIKDCLAQKSNIAMSSRELKADEKEKLEGHTFAIDAIAVIVNKDNTLNGISSEMVTKIFKGEVRSWDNVK